MPEQSPTRAISQRSMTSFSSACLSRFVMKRFSAFGGFFALLGGVSDVLLLEPKQPEHAVEKTASAMQQTKLRDPRCRTHRTIRVVKRWRTSCIRRGPAYRPLRERAVLDRLI